MAITGIILAGGKSSRMGLEKGLMDFKSKPMVSFAIEALSEVVDDTIIIANESVYELFDLKVYRDLYPETGPLGGICTGLTHSKTEQNIVLSCDTPFVTPALLRYLIEKAGNSGLAVCSIKKAIQPLVGLYSKSIEPELKKHLLSGQLGMKAVIAQLPHLEVEINEDLSFYHPNLFYNINRPEDLGNAEKLRLPGA